MFIVLRSKYHLSLEGGVEVEVEVDNQTSTKLRLTRLDNYHVLEYMLNV